jgi:hypothetical protein
MAGFLGGSEGKGTIVVRENGRPDRSVRGPACRKSTGGGRLRIEVEEQVGFSARAFFRNRYRYLRLISWIDKRSTRIFVAPSAWRPIDTQPGTI